MVIATEIASLYNTFALVAFKGANYVLFYHDLFVEVINEVATSS
jgi:hypothetical protein